MIYFRLLVYNFVVLYPKKLEYTSPLNWFYFLGLPAPLFLVLSMLNICLPVFGLELYNFAEVTNFSKLKRHQPWSISSNEIPSVILVCPCVISLEFSVIKPLRNVCSKCVLNRFQNMRSEILRFYYTQSYEAGYITYRLTRNQNYDDVSLPTSQ